MSLVSPFHVTYELWKYLTGAPCVPLPPFSPATPIGPYKKQTSLEKHLYAAHLQELKANISGALKTSSAQMINGFAGIKTLKFKVQKRTMTLFSSSSSLSKKVSGQLCVNKFLKRIFHLVSLRVQLTGGP